MSNSILSLQRHIYHVAIALIATLGSTNGQAVGTFSQGAKTFFMGHSFFIPIANNFDQFSQYGSQLYPSHEYDSFFKGGDGGSPIYLWNNHKAEIEAKLTSDTELFGMTIAASAADLTPEEALEGYTQWIDLAKEYNPDMSFFIGLPWPDFPETYGTADAYEAFNDDNAATAFQLVSDMRELYPENDIFFLNYGALTVEAVKLFEMGRLVDITSFRGGSDDTSLFTDPKGHAGSMIKELSGLAWLYLFYGTSAVTILDAASDLLGWDLTNAREIFMATFQKNKGYML